MIRKEDSLGIPNYGPWYIELLPDQDEQEVDKMHDFIISVIQSNTIPEFQGEKRLQFINYGSTQLVFVLTINEDRQYTLLVNQPATEFGTGKREYENLKFLSRNNSENVVKPLYYFGDDRNELYVTPYYYQSRCVGVNTTDWGMWIPEPEYHFEKFDDEKRRVINASMVAMLVKLYDDKRKIGLAECRLDGGDFMLEKGFEDDDIKFENILKRIKLIAARKLVSMDFNNYIDRIKREFSGNLEKDEEEIIVGEDLRSTIIMEEIEEGIKLGIELRQKERDNKFLIF